MKDLEFMNFCHARHKVRGDAAKFKSIDSQGPYVFWCNESDLNRYLELFPQHENEINKGIKEYAEAEE